MKEMLYRDTIMDLELAYGNDDTEQDLLVENPNPIPADDAFVIMLNQKGSIHLPLWSWLCGEKEEDLIATYEGKQMWQDPKEYLMTFSRKTGWLTRQEYVKGNIVKKYMEAVSANQETGLFACNVRVLYENMPDKVDPADIFANMGAPWVPKSILTQFTKQLLLLEIEPRIEYSDYLGEWVFQNIDSPNYVIKYYTYGTKRMDAVKIITHMINAKVIKVYDQVPKLDGTNKTESVINQEETLLAQEREKEIHQKWIEFLHGNKVYEEWLQEAYMTFFGYTVSKYDGSFLRLADMNGKVSLYPHQRDAIARILFNKNTLLAHNVGSGKTYEFEVGIHELIRIGLSKKALVVVPNNTLDAAAAAYQDIFPQDKILVVRPKKEFAPKNRIKTLELIKSDDYSVIFMAYSSFDMITLSGSYLIKKKEEEIRECRLQRDNATTYSMRHKLDVVLNRLRKSLEKFKEEYEPSKMEVFDSLGIDILCVDEAHNYKNITLDHSCENIVGLHAKGSKKADNMLDKVEYIQKNDGRVIFATGTPLCNSLADLYIMQRYLQPQEMKLCKIFHFSNWVSTFAEREHSFEIDVDSSNYRFTTRFSRFYNLPELMGLFSDVCDFYQASSQEERLPKFQGHTDIVVKKSASLAAYIKKLAARTEAIRNREVTRKEDNLLLITVDGRQAALDIRLVDKEADITGCETKVKACADQMAAIYHQKTDVTQIAFCDISTPKTGFNVYDELKKELILRGIDPSDVMFIHQADTEAKRSKVEALFNAGEIRILIGSTQKLGTGSNVQERLYAIHHLDVPWRPADMTQREGRIIRQGNLNEEVFVYRYITEASFDAYTYQILENKQKFISQFLSGSLSAIHREETDCSDTVLSYAEVKALAIGNPLIKDRVLVANQLEQAKTNQRQKRKELSQLREHLEAIPRRIASQKRLMEGTRADIAFYKDMEKEVITKEDRKSFGEELLAALSHNEMRDTNRLFEEYRGFPVYLPKHMEASKPYVILSRRGGGVYKIAMDGDKALGCTKRLDNVIDRLDNVLLKQEDILQDLYQQEAKAKEEYENGNPFDETVKELSEKLEQIDKLLKEENS